MKLLIMSDSHGSLMNMYDAIDKENPDCMIFLGDGEDDFTTVSNFKPNVLREFKVAGNCDHGSVLPLNLTKEIGEVKFYITHGHKEGVKRGLYDLYAKASVEGAKAALYGHTHCADVQYMNGMLLLNPGTIASGYYATIIIENGELKPELKFLGD